MKNERERELERKGEKVETQGVLQMGRSFEIGKTDWKKVDCHVSEDTIWYWQDYWHSFPIFILLLLLHRLDYWLEYFISNLRIVTIATN